MYLHLNDISGEKSALYFHNLLSENVENLPFISFYEDFSVSLENRGNATLCTVARLPDVGAVVTSQRGDVSNCRSLN